MCRISSRKRCFPSAPVRPATASTTICSLCPGASPLAHRGADQQHPSRLCGAMRPACSGIGDHVVNRSGETLCVEWANIQRYRRVYASPPSAQIPDPQFDLETFKRFIAGTDNIDAGWLAARSPICPWNRTTACFLHPLYTKGRKGHHFRRLRSQGQEVWSHPGLPFDARALKRFIKGQRHGVWFLSCPVDGLLSSQR